MKKWRVVLGIMIFGLAISQVWSDEEHAPPRLFSVGSGYDNGVYYWLATMLGGVISHPQQNLPCGHGGNCGVENLLLVNIATEGSLENLALLRTDKLDSAFVQSNAAYQSYTATDGQKEAAFTDLRVLASLYSESLHLVVHADSNIRQISDLIGKRVAVGAKGSGTYLTVRDLLRAHHIAESQFDADYRDTKAVEKQFLDHQLDAIFYVAGVPTPQVVSLSKKTAIRLVATGDDEASDSLLTHHYYTVSTIPGGTYHGQTDSISVLNVQALWVVNQKRVNDALAYQLTRALWSHHYQDLFYQLFPPPALTVEHSLDGVGIPLHSGAKRYYDEIGKRF